MEGAAPERFTQEHLKGIGFRGSNDRAVVPLLKAPSFLAPDGTPTSRYNAYRDKSRSRIVMAEALLEAYQDLFTINENPTSEDRPAIEARFKSSHNVSDRVAKEQAATFFALLALADLPAARTGTLQAALEEPTENVPPTLPDTGPSSSGEVPPKPAALNLRYNIEVHLPPTKDVEVYSAIFKALREHLLVD